MLLDDFSNISGHRVLILIELLSLDNLVYFFDFTAAASLFDVFKVGRSIVVVNIRAETSHLNHVFSYGV